MNTVELQRLTKDRLRDAKTLLEGKRWSAAYYLAGYAVECGLKCCVIRHLMKTDRFPERRYSEQCWTHNVDFTHHPLGIAGFVRCDPHNG